MWWPSRKILHSAGVFTFFGFTRRERRAGVGKDETKIIRCFWKSILDRFGTVLELFLDDFWLRIGSKNVVKYSVFIVFVYRKYILQQRKNCVNTTVFAWPKAKNTVNTVIFATKGKKHRKYRGFRLPQCKNHWYLQHILLQGFQKYAKTPPNWWFLGSTKMRQ